MAIAYKNILKRNHNISTAIPIVSGGTTEISSDTTNKKVVTELDIANVNATGAVIAEVAILRATDVFYIVKNASIPAGSSLKIINNQKTVLMAGDSLHVRIADGAQYVDIIGSYLDDVD